MVDTFIANASPDDLRALVRGLLASGTPGLAANFTAAARRRFHSTATAKPCSIQTPFFTMSSDDPDATPSAESTEHLEHILNRARSYYGVGLGFASLTMLTDVVRSTKGLEWEDVSQMTSALSVVDSDITQAIQSSKEELDAGRVEDLSVAHQAVDELRRAILESHREVKAWGGEPPFERSLASVLHWKL